MGLDMYLEAEQYVGGWDHLPEPERDRYALLLGLAGPVAGLACKDSPGARILVTVAYWRKANAVHRWFVEQVQEGRDECQRALVPRDKLRELVEACKRVLATVETVEGDVSMGTAFTRGDDGEPVKRELTRPGLVVAQQGIAAAVLPTKDGFFFGNTDYDEGYFDDLRATVEQIEPVLALPEEAADIYYRASW